MPPECCRRRRPGLLGHVHERLTCVELAVPREETFGRERPAGNGPRVTGGEDAPGHRDEMRREEDLHGTAGHVTERLFGQLPDATWVYPGHGDDTTLIALLERIARRADGWLARAAGNMTGKDAGFLGMQVGPGKLPVALSGAAGGSECAMRSRSIVMMTIMAIPSA